MLCIRGEPGAYRFRNAVKGFGENDVYLAPGRWPASIGMRPVRIPISAMTTCSRAKWDGSHWDAVLWIRETGVEISVTDNDGAVAKWCNGRGIPIER